MHNVVRWSVAVCLTGCFLFCTLEAQEIVDQLEEGDVGGMPEDWFVPPSLASRGVRAALTDKTAHQSKRCLQLVGPPGGFANVMRVIDATPYRGQRIKLAAAVRVREPSEAQLWLRVDRTAGAAGFFDNMHDRPIRDDQWKEYEITGEIAEDAVTINLGMMLMQGGTAWLDSVSVVPVGPVGEHDESARELSDRGLANLIAATRLVGYVRYFHPSDQAAAIDWDAMTIHLARGVEGARDDAALVDALTALVQPIAPAVRITHRIPLEADNARLRPRTVEPDHLIRWKHFGVSSHLTGENQPAVFRSVRETTAITDAERETPQRPLVVLRELAPNVWCELPIDLYVKRGMTLPRGEGEFDPRGSWPQDWSPSARDRATRLAGVMLTWTVMQHFYPYFDVVETDWNAALVHALRSAAVAEGDQAHLLTLRELIAKLHDGHGNAVHPSVRSATELPMVWCWVEDELVVTTVADGVDDLAPGDVVQAIDGRSVSECHSDLAAQTSGATPQWIRFRTASQLRTAWPTASPTLLTIRRADGSVADVAIERVPTGTMPYDDLERPENGAEIAPGIVFVNLDGLDDIRPWLPRLRAAKGIVFDLRGYPSGAGKMILHHLTDEIITSPQWHVPEVELPDQETMTFHQIPGWRVEPRKPRLRAEVIFLTEGRAISYAESCLGVVAHYKLGEILGGPTAGTNGNINPFTVPGGYQIMWTGMKVLKHDGSTHHGVGIPPTLPVSRTIAGIRGQSDELLAAAVQTLQSRLNQHVPVR